MSWHPGMKTACKDCGFEWTSLSLCHCSSCHETFLSVGAFDVHRAKFQCEQPWVAGLSLRESRGVVAWGRVGEGKPAKSQVIESTAAQK